MKVRGWLRLRQKLLNNLMQNVINWCDGENSQDQKDQGNHQPATWMEWYLSSVWWDRIRCSWHKGLFSFRARLTKRLPRLLFQKAISSNPPIESFWFFQIDTGNWGHMKPVMSKVTPANVDFCIVMFGGAYDVISARHVLTTVTPRLCVGDKETISLWPDSLMQVHQVHDGQTGSLLSNHKICLFPHSSFSTQFLLLLFAFYQT